MLWHQEDLAQRRRDAKEERGLFLDSGFLLSTIAHRKCGGGGEVFYHGGTEGGTEDGSFFLLSLFLIVGFCAAGGSALPFLAGLWLLRCRR